MPYASNMQPLTFSFLLLPVFIFDSNQLIGEFPFVILQLLLLPFAIHSHWLLLFYQQHHLLHVMPTLSIFWPFLLYLKFLSCMLHSKHLFLFIILSLQSCCSSIEMHFRRQLKLLPKLIKLLILIMLLFFKGSFELPILNNIFALRL